MFDQSRLIWMGRVSPDETRFWLNQFLVFSSAHSVASHNRDMSSFSENCKITEQFRQKGLLEVMFHSPCLWSATWNQVPSAVSRQLLNIGKEWDPHILWAACASAHDVQRELPVFQLVPINFLLSLLALFSIIYSGIHIQYKVPSEPHLLQI